MAPFNPVNPRQNFPELEDEITKFWKENKIFEKSIESRPTGDKYVFYDGPPFITGMPHYGHLLGSIAKDVIPRYQTMLGKRVERKWGWDCHGLPIENKVEQKLGLKNRRDIEKLGIQKFIDECYQYTKETSAEWEWYIDKIGRWVDFENSYKTMDQDYMETVMWVFKQLWDKKMIYQGTRVSLFCTRCGTPISNFEIAMDNSYEDMEDPAVTVKFPLLQAKGKPELKGASMLAWTTTPWTMPSNRALVVDPEEDYVIATVQKIDIELEKGWLVKELPKDLTKYKSVNITQAYLDNYTDTDGKKPKNARIRKMNDEYTFTRKYFAGDEKETGQLIEKTEKITKEKYIELIKTATKKIVKTRYFYPLDDRLTAEIDVYQNNLQGLVVAEVEFPTLKIEKEFVAPEWFDKEVTDSKGIYPPVIADMSFEQVKKMNEEYVQAPHNYRSAVQTEKVVLAKKRIEAVLSGSDYEILKEIKGKDLVGLSYKAPYDYFPANENDLKVYAYEDMVTMDEGTGIVHSAPGFGEIDTQMGETKGLTTMFAVNDEGKFVKEVTDFAGIYIKDADPLIMADLKSRDLLFKAERIVHRYPYCYRCHTPLIQKAQPSWYVDIKSLKPKMLETNAKINWVPDHLKEGRFGKGVKQAPDWGISRSRYWATPMPVWKCEGELDKSIKIVMVHGNGKTEDLTIPRSWFPYMLKEFEKLGIEAHAPHMPEPEIAPKDKWLAFLEDEMKVDENTIIIGQSSGAVAALRYVEEHKVKGLIIIAACCTDLGDEIEKKSGFYDEEWQWEKIKSNTNWIIQYHSKDDPAVPFAEGEFISQKIDSDFRVYENAGHFSHSGDGRREFPEIVEDVRKKLLKSNCDHMEVFGSKAEIEERSGQKIEDLHRPKIDEITMDCPKCKGTMRRIPEVLDVWMDSGSMPYAQRHYPFENKQDFEANYPADFIVEYVGQTRAWFYTMHVLSNALFGSESFKNVVATGVMAGNDGRKMSKSYGNYPDPKGVLIKHGAEALRMYFMSSPIMVGEDMNIDENGIVEQLKSFILPFWNSYSFFVTYANMHNWKPEASLLHKKTVQNDDVKFVEGEKIGTYWYKVPLVDIDNKLDIWIIAKLQLLIREVRMHLEGYDLPSAAREFPKFVDDLSKWYIRRSRDRFASGDKAALDTLYYVLVEFIRLLAPFTPFISENIWQNIVKGPIETAEESIHLSDYPQDDLEFIEKSSKIMMQMDALREIVNLGQSIRVEKGIKVRQPLAEMEINLDIQAQRNYEIEDWMKQLISGELNVKTVDEDNDPAKAQGWEYRESADKRIKISLNTQLTDSLIREGLYRELVRSVQAQRKKQNMDLNREINIILISKDPILQVVANEYKNEILKSTNAIEISVKKDSPKTGFRINAIEVDIEIG